MPSPRLPCADTAVTRRPPNAGTFGLHWPQPRRACCAVALALLAALPAVRASAQASMARPAYTLDQLIAAARPIEPVAFAAVPAPYPPRRTSSHHEVRIDGRPVGYTALVEETFLPADDSTRAAAAMVTIAYLADAPTPSARPVMFVFNGGPGASSRPLQGGMAPRVPSHDDPARYVDNPHSPLDVADLVFIDPIGTGFSRALPGQSPQSFWSTRGDAQSVRYFIQAWLKAHHRQSSPRYLVGESYGTSRAGHIAEIGADLDLDGIVLVSMTGAPDGLDLPYVMSFPTLASVAAYHGKGEAAGHDPQTVFADNLAFAQGPYLQALVQGRRLPQSQREAIAEAMARRLGLSRQFLLDHDLRLSNEDFMLNLLKERGQRTGQLDGRATGALATYATRTPPYDDPAMTLGAGKPNTPDAPASSDEQVRYMADELGFSSDDGYLPLNLRMLFSFRHDVDLGYRPTDAIATLIQRQHKLRLMLAGGLYDLTTPFAAARYNLAHTDIPPERVQVRAYAAGHEVYDAANIAAFNQDIREFVDGK